MTDLPPTTVLHETPTLTMPAVRTRRPTARHWAPVVVLVVVDSLVAMFLVGTMLGAMFPSDLADRDTATRSPVPSPVVSDPAIGGGEPVAAGALPSGRRGGGRDGGAPPARGVTASTTVAAVVPDAAPTRGQIPQGPAGGPASTTTTAEAPTLPPAGPETTSPTAPPDSTPPATEPVPDTTPSTIGETSDASLP